jgi:hypothetical protein
MLTPGTKRVHRMTTHSPTGQRSIRIKEGSALRVVSIMCNVLVSADRAWHNIMHTSQPSKKIGCIQYQVGPCKTSDQLAETEKNGKTTGGGDAM